MSMRVMQVKYNSRVKNNQVNSRTILNGGPFALGFTNTGKKQGDCCDNGVGAPSAPSHQQGYGLYLKRAKMGIGSGGGGMGAQPSGGLASRVVGESFVDPSFNRGTQQRLLTYKRPQSSEGFSSSSYIDNLRSRALRCNYSSESLKFGDVNDCKPDVEPICYDSCNKNISITKNLGYLSASQQINKKLSLRAGPNVNVDYESPMMKAPITGGNC